MKIWIEWQICMCTVKLLLLLNFWGHSHLCNHLNRIHIHKHFFFTKAETNIEHWINEPKRFSFLFSIYLWPFYSFFFLFFFFWLTGLEKLVFSILFYRMEKKFFEQKMIKKRKREAFLYFFSYCSLVIVTGHKLFLYNVAIFQELVIKKTQSHKMKMLILLFILF